MHRRPLGRPRVLVTIAAALMLLASVLPWWTVGGDDGLPILSGNGLDGSGMLVFLAAVASLALLTLPYAAERPVAADRWPTYGLFTGTAWVGLALRVAGLAASGAFAFREPTEIVSRMPGLWLAVLGLLLLSRGVYEIAGEHPRG